MPLISSRLFWLPFALLIAGGLLLPAYGPLISPSYAELLPEHNHVMLKGTPYHSHFYESGGSSDGSDVLAVPRTAADGAIAVVIAAGAALLALQVLLTAPTGLRRLASGRTLALLHGIALAPTARPPKPSLSLS